MAAPSRPSLRSSARRIASLEDVPPTDAQHNPQPKARRGKRPRDSSPGSQSNVSIKKQKITPPKQSDRSTDVAKRKALNSLPLRDKADTKDAVTSRQSHPPQTQVNGTKSSTTTTSTSTLPDGHPTIKLQKFTVNTTAGANQADKRSLRSHDGGSRSKSELALYFPNYDELVSIEPKEPEFLTADTLLHIIDEPSKTTPAAASSSSTLKNASSKSYQPYSIHSTTNNGSSQGLDLSEATFTDLNDATRIDLSSLDKPTKYQKDPMNETLYLKAHRRAERQEKQLRNIEKERAMHEKVQLERLMNGLRGHDWLRVMGISGITDGEKKAYEPKRDYFIQQVRILLKKFQAWKEEEKRRKVEKDDSMQDEDEEGGDEYKRSSRESDGDPPDYTDVDASAARQLHHEAIQATKPSSSDQARSHRKKPPAFPPVEQPFTSFFSKSYLREAAISKHRRGRARYAFGQPIPDLPEHEFELGDALLTPDVVAAQERKRRAAKRHV